MRCPTPGGGATTASCKAVIPQHTKIFPSFMVPGSWNVIHPLSEGDEADVGRNAAQWSRCAHSGSAFSARGILSLGPARHRSQPVSPALMSPSACSASSASKEHNQWSGCVRFRI